MARTQIKGRVKQIREQLETLRPARAFRKLFAIMNALEIQVEDGHYQRHAVERLCEALLATRELYDVPDDTAQRLEDLACEVVDHVGRRR